MKKSKKLMLLALSVAVALSLVFTWPAKVSAEDVVLTLWHWETPPHRVKIIDELADEFEAVTGIKIKQSVIPFPDYYGKIMAAIAAKELPDMIWINPPQLPILLEHDVIIPLTEIFEDLHAKYTFPEPLSQVYKVNAEQYAIPIFGVAWPLTYRADLYKEHGLDAPEFWDEALEAAEKLHDPAGGIYGFGLPVSIKGNYGSQAVWGFMSTNGARIVGFEDGKEKIVFNSPKTVKTYEFLKKLAKFTSPGAANMDWGMAELMIRQGRFATVMYNSAWLRQLDKDNPELASKYAMTFLPRPRDGQIAHTGYPRAFTVTKAAVQKGHMEAVKRFLKWIYEPKNNATLLRMENAFFLPVTEVTANSKEFKDIPLVEKYWDMMEVQAKVLGTAKVIGFPPGGMSRHTGAIESSFTLGAVLQKIVIDGWTVEKAVKWGQEQYEEIIR